MNSKIRMSERYLNKDYLVANPDWHAKDSKFKSDHIIKLLKKNNIKLFTLAEANLEVLDYFFTAPFLIESNQPSTLKGRVIYVIRRLIFKISPNLLSKTFCGCSIMVLAK